MHLSIHVHVYPYEVHMKFHKLFANLPSVSLEMPILGIIDIAEIVVCSVANHPQFFGKIRNVS